MVATVPGTAPIVLLGPQRMRPTLIEPIRSLGISGRVATITAGWREREKDDSELHDHLEGRSVNLELYRRAEQVFDSDPELARAHHERQATLQQMQGLYDVRLSHAMEACFALLRREAPPDLIWRERRAALEAIRELDRLHLERVREIHETFEARLHPLDRLAVVAERRQIGEILDRTEAVAIAGGHVAVLLNRLRLFGMGELLAHRPLIAWSAGAMAVSERVILFHGSPPQGPGNAEALDIGLGLARGVVPFPHARRRLQLEDADRLWILSGRLAPAYGVLLDSGSRVEWNGRRWSASPGNLRIAPEGRLEEIGA
jgi:hypothetical protein